MNQADRVRARLIMVLSYAVSIQKLLVSPNASEFFDKQRMNESYLALEMEIEELFIELCNTQKKIPTVEGGYLSKTWKNKYIYSISPWVMNINGGE